MTIDSHRAPNAGPLASTKAKLIALGYPWPENLENKSLSWLQEEIRDIAPTSDPGTAGGPA
jgi:hypothetical protein